MRRAYRPRSGLMRLHKVLRVTQRRTKAALAAAKGKGKRVNRLRIAEVQQRATAASIELVGPPSPRPRISARAQYAQPQLHPYVQHYFLGRTFYLSRTATWPPVLT